MTGNRETGPDIQRLEGNVDELISILSGSKDIDTETSLRFLEILTNKPELKHKRFSRRIRRRLNVGEHNNKDVVIQWLKSVIELLNEEEIPKFQIGESFTLSEYNFSTESLTTLQNTLRKISYFLFFKEYKAFLEKRNAVFQVRIGISGAISHILEGI